MLIISCSHGIHLGAKIARRLNAKHSALSTDKFPDGEIHVRFLDSVKGKTVALVQSFYGSIQDCIVEALFAAFNARDLGAKRIILAAPYFPYFRQDKRFRKGDAISINAIASLIDAYFDGIVVMDPHLHRKNSIDKIFRIKAMRLSANKKIADYIRKNFSNPVLIGPDAESYKWAGNVADIIGADSYIYSKKRYSSYHVEVSLDKKADLKGRRIVIVDDIVSTGNTILQTAGDLRRYKPKRISCVCVHGIFAGNILKRLKEKNIDIVSTNTIPNSKGIIDISDVIADALGKWRF